VVATLPSAPPAFTAPAPVLQDIEFVSGSRAWHISIGTPCARVFTTRFMRVPSQRMTLVVSCDDPNSSFSVVPIETPDELSTPPARKQKS
jgi:hypothetical protein